MSEKNKHPAAGAWDAWIESIHGEKNASGEAAGEYLRNRLWWAFMAGWDAAQEAARKDQEAKP